MKFNLNPWNLSLRLGLTAILPLVAPLASVGQAEKSNSPAKAAAPATLPPASEVIGKFIKAIGGKEAYSKIESQHGKGKFELAAQGISGDLEVFHKRPNKLRVKVGIPSIGDILTGFDGKVGWSMNAATGPMLLEGKALEQMREQADFDSVFNEESD